VNACAWDEQRNDSLNADAEKTLAAQRVTEEANGPVQQLTVEVDQNVAARDELDLRKHAAAEFRIIADLRRRTA
jgi:hypothetical protein